MGRILVGYDGSEPSRRALDLAIKQALAAGDEIVVLTVIPPSVANSSLAGMMPAGIDLPANMAQTFEQGARRRLDDIIRDTRASGVKLRGEVRSGEGLHVFMETTKELGITHIIIGHKSFEREAMQLGPIAERLVKQLPTTVTVVR